MHFLLYFFRKGYNTMIMNAYSLFRIPLRGCYWRETINKSMLPAQSYPHYIFRP